MPQGAYGSNVNVLVDSGHWDDDDELAEQYSSRKCFAYTDAAAYLNASRSSSSRRSPMST